MSGLFFVRKQWSGFVEEFSGNIIVFLSSLFFVFKQRSVFLEELSLNIDVHRCSFVSLDLTALHFFFYLT